MKYIIFKTLGLIAMAMSLFSCASSKRVYVKDTVVDSLYQVMNMPPLRIQKSDRLSIQVSAKDAELAAPFNTYGGVYRIDEKGSVGSANASSNLERGYLVDQNGMIEFPVLGSLRVEGKTIDQVKTMIRERLISENFIGAPVVRVELSNLKIMMMGEVATVGVIDVPDGRITLLEAINRSGGLTPNAMENEVMVIREENGQRRMYQNDIEANAIFNSPVYYLQQNDIVYVRPKAATITPKAELNWRYVSYVTTFLTLGATIWLIMLRR